ncbi:MAG: dTDP-4-dehydrorhamnose 3,5-epimerase [Solirubrobacteraceae bacterium]|jgi:dTDP-4-dehydrorhamnose 3,5-epimerase|nr:dTDP-4-dehydrorhamnose 3,5-epimerase [Solirubrobacteraceae bacterium]
MQRLPTQLEGPVLLAPRVHDDGRGFFVETFRADAWAEHGVDLDWVQDNQSRSRRGTLRGMHFQTEPGQAKLVRCARGAIFDVIVDIRPDSQSFGAWEGCVLDDERQLQLFVPIGFAHGFCVITEFADVVYKCSSYYDAATEAGFAYDDPAVGIEWPDIELTISPRDRDALPFGSVAERLRAHAA